MNPVALYNHEPLTSAAKQHQFDPYEMNGGTSLVIKGSDFCVVASDTRQSVGFQINSRYAPKTFKLTDNAVITASGFSADSLALFKKLSQNLEWYKHAHDKVMSTPAIAQMLSNTLYYKRFFPYYSFCLVGGIDEQGRGVAYSYDPMGSYGPEPYKSVGSASTLIQPFLDNQARVGHQNQQIVQQSEISLESAISITKDAFTSASERDIYTGDFLEIFVIKQGGVTVERVDLRKD
ncbi:4465_t:CDS:2 [Funneliformis geosporum]|uniref:6996_t:CDS:1 n=1 Tax=Funneliformis geosporum TaxID=1117311 RepID=A0A9W4SUJ0_9GLOM|nr:6996_t:CDS:2 [Funneliformis geosporum]CAI2181883.1 4465_t:CDS:2 [Funneliformis geosporum]